MRRSALNRRERRPTHPGALLKEDILPAAKISQTELANMIGVSRRAINELCQEKRAVSVDMAHRLARVFNTSPESWLHMQLAVDIWDELQARKREYDRIEPIELKDAIKPELDSQAPDILAVESPGEGGSTIKAIPLNVPEGLVVPLSEIPTIRNAFKSLERA